MNSHTMRKSSLLLLFICLTIGAFSQEPGDFPPNSEPGKCYAKCLIADDYEEVTERVVVKPASKKTEIIPTSLVVFSGSWSDKWASSVSEIRSDCFSLLHNPSILEVVFNTSPEYTISFFILPTHPVETSPEWIPALNSGTRPNFLVY